MAIETPIRIVPHADIEDPQFAVGGKLTPLAMTLHRIANFKAAMETVEANDGAPLGAHYTLRKAEEIYNALAFLVQNFPSAGQRLMEYDQRVNRRYEVPIFNGASYDADSAIKNEEIAPKFLAWANSDEIKEHLQAFDTIIREETNKLAAAVMRQADVVPDPVRARIESSDRMARFPPR